MSRADKDYTVPSQLLLKCFHGCNFGKNGSGIKQGWEPLKQRKQKSRSKRDRRQDVSGSDREQFNTEERQKLLHTVTQQSLSELRIMSASSRADSLISPNTQTHKRTTMRLMNIIVHALREHSSADLSTTAPWQSQNTQQTAARK